MRNMLVLVALSLSVFAGCSSDSDSSNSGTSADGGTASDGSSSDGSSTNPATFNSAAICKAAYDREVKCGKTPGVEQATYTGNCQKDLECTEKLILNEFMVEFWPCAASRDCNTSDDDCAESFGKQQLAKADIKAAYDKCMALHASCSEKGVSFSDDECTLPIVANSALRTEFDACLAKTDCAELKACFDAISAKSEACDVQWDPTGPKPPTF